MIYDKLPIVLLTTLATNKSDATNSTIAKYILEHLSEIEDITISSLASQCHVATSSISRFCKEIGLEDYSELKELLETTHASFQQVAAIDDYMKAIHEALDSVKQSISFLKIQQLCKDIKRYKRVAIFGLLKSAGVAINLQTDLYMLGKSTYTTLTYANQMEYLSQVNEDDLVIIISYTCSYFDHQRIDTILPCLKKAKVYMIGANTSKHLSFVDEMVTFASLKDQISQPNQLQFVIGLISQEYAKIKKS